jgi:hypothetical protein
MFRSLLGKVFGRMLTPETTRSEANALAAQLQSTARISLWRLSSMKA